MLAYVHRRVAEQSAAAPTLPVSRITLGFEFGNENWVALLSLIRVPNRRPMADGPYRRGGQDAQLRRPGWPNWGEKPEERTWSFLPMSPDQEVDITDNPDDLGCKVIGDAMRQVLLTANKEGAFDSLAKAARCELEVENFDGYYGWLASKDPASMA